MELDEKTLIRSGLNPTSYVTLYAIFYENKEILQYIKNLKIFKKVLEILQKNGYIKITGEEEDDFILRKKTLSLLGNKIKVEEWYEDWRNLFPEGVNPSGYYYRGNKQEVLSKLKKFVEKNPKYSKEDIFNATEKYIKRCIRSGSYMFLAHYFIHKKDVGSTLLTELEHLDDDDSVQTRRVTAL